MSSFGSQLRKRIEELRKAGQNVPKILDEVAEGATIEAVRVAEENTPPNGGAAIAGTNTRSGEMAQSWATDSVTTYGRRIVRRDYVYDRFSQQYAVQQLCK